MRYPRLILLIGTNGTGKTTVQKKMMLPELRKDNGRVLILVPDELEWTNIPMVHPDRPGRIAWYYGARRMIITRSTLKDKLEMIRNHFKNGQLYFDDFRSFTGARTEAEFEELLIRRRQNSVDIFAVGHGFEKIPRAFFSYATDIILFKTVGTIKDRREYLNEPDRIEAAQRRVNERANDTEKAWVDKNDISKNRHYHEPIKL